MNVGVLNLLLSELVVLVGELIIYIALKVADDGIKDKKV